MKKRVWREYLWIASLIYFSLGFFNILFAWLGLICMILPLGFALLPGNKNFCAYYCGRGQLFTLLGTKLGLSAKKDIPAFIRSRYFRYGFMLFFTVMFVNMIAMTWNVFSGTAELKEAVRLLWTFDLPWNRAGRSAFVSPWVIQFAYGFYGVMFTSLVLGFITMAMYKPRSWCVYCPMGTATQLICGLKNKEATQEAVRR